MPVMKTIATTAPAAKTCHSWVTPGTVSPKAFSCAAPEFSMTTAAANAMAAPASSRPKKIMRRVSSPNYDDPRAPPAAPVSPRWNGIRRSTAKILAGKGA
ncbi:hypothetical protein GCM10023085_49750 [Actinomadura viridis]